LQRGALLLLEDIPPHPVRFANGRAPPRNRLKCAGGFSYLADRAQQVDCDNFKNAVGASLGMARTRVRRGAERATRTAWAGVRLQSGANRCDGMAIK
jgi:hypothetical protein